MKLKRNFRIFDHKEDRFLSGYLTEGQANRYLPVLTRAYRAYEGRFSIVEVG